jgi:hypothetical protein
MPVTTVECERGFSKLKLVKTPTRNALEKNLNARLRLYIAEKLLDQNYEFFEAAIAIWFSQQNSRRTARGEYDKSDAPIENNTGKITDIQKYPGNAAMDLTQLNTLALERPLINNGNVFVMNNHGTIHA